MSVRSSVTPLSAFLSVHLADTQSGSPTRPAYVSALLSESHAIWPERSIGRLQDTADVGGTSLLGLRGFLLPLHRGDWERNLNTKNEEIMRHRFQIEKNSDSRRHKNNKN